MAVSSNRNVGCGLERALHHWRQRGALLEKKVVDSAPGPLTVAISRQCGAGAVAVAEALGAKLDWPVYDRQLVDRIAEDAGVRATLVASLDEKRPNWFSTGISSFSPERQLSPIGYAMRLREILAALAGHGRCIIVGRGAAQLLPPATTLRVRLIAPRDFRIAHVAAQLAIDEGAAARYVDDTDQGRSEFVQTHFRRSVDDPLGYDVTLDTSRIDVAACADVAVVALESLGQNVRD